MRAELVREHQSKVRVSYKWTKSSPQSERDSGFIKWTLFIEQAEVERPRLSYRVLGN